MLLWYVTWCSHKRSKKNRSRVTYSRENTLNMFWRGVRNGLKEVPARILAREYTWLIWALWYTSTARFSRREVCGRVFGAFVVVTGTTMFIVAQDPPRYSKLLRVWGFCFLFVAVVTFLGGFPSNMSFIHYTFDFIFYALIAMVCFSFGRQRKHIWSNDQWSILACRSALEAHVEPFGARISWIHTTHWWFEPYFF